MTKKLLNKILTVAFCAVFLSGCTSLGSYVLSNPDTYLSEAEFIHADPEDIGFSKLEFCSPDNETCIPYLLARPYQAKDIPEGSAVFYNLHATGNGVENTISHSMTRDTFEQYSGTAVLLRGYGGNKEVMMASALYFRAIGMQVIIPDLNGHGESPQPFSVATREHEIIDELLSSLDEESSLTLAIGHSMGTVTAAKLLSSNSIDGAILLAPMMRFDLAATEFLEYK